LQKWCDIIKKDTLECPEVKVMNSRIRNLPIDERIRLVQDLWDSISADQNQLSLTDEQKEELDRRIDAFEVDKNKGRLAKDVLADIRRKL
jgi:putative addiction module component (TIGR02574 family)